MRIVADLELTPSTRSFGLPGAGTRSVLMGVGDGEERELFGVVITTADGRDLVPGTRLPGARLELWVPDAALPRLSPGDTFALWYGDDIGTGVVVAVARSLDT